ncbi:S41 family peptidase [Mycoplasmatota bacterium WC44]
MKKLLALVLLFILVGCEVNDERVTDEQKLTKWNLLGEEEVLEDIDGIDYLKFNGIDYASVSDLADLMSFNFLSNKWRMTKFTYEYKEDHLYMSQKSENVVMKFYYDGKVVYDTKQFYLSDFDGFKDKGVLDSFDDVNSIDIDGSVEYPKYFSPVPDSQRPEKRFEYHKEIDINDFGLEAVYEDELYMPVHLISFLFNGFQGLNYTVKDDVFHVTEYDDYGTVIPNNKIALNDEMKEYYIGFFDFLYNEYYFSKDVYLDLYNELKDDTYTDMRAATTYDEFYKSFFAMLSVLKDHHTYKGYISQSEPEIESAYWDMRDNHFSSGNLPVGYYSYSFDYEMLEDTLWIKLGTFSEGYSDEIQELIDLNEPKALIIDIRGNTGGYSHHCYNTVGTIANEFSTYEKDQEGYKSAYFIEMQDDHWYEGDVYVLTTEMSFSAASQFTQIVKDNELGTIVGEPHGGGHSSVIPVFLPDGSILHMSVAKVGMIGKLGNWIDFGTEPDVYVKDEFIDGKDQILETTLALINEQ